jgi:hypothetical protein
MARYSAVRRTNLCAFAVAASLLTGGAARADEPLPSQEEALARVLASHPDIVAAKAKVALAEAELYGKRMEVSRQVLELYGSLNGFEAQINAAKAALSQSEAQFARASAREATGGLPDQVWREQLTAEVQAAQAKLVLIMGQRAQVESELRLLCGSTTEAEAPLTVAPAAVVQLQPRGPIKEKLEGAAAKLITLDFVDSPLEAILQVLSDETDVKFSPHRPALDASGISVDMTISLQTSEVRLFDALQAFEDAYPEMVFVLRDYGVLLTTRDYAQESGWGNRSIVAWGNQAKESTQ